jgi:uncharacterized damage-inducible protein DinB
MKSGRPRRYDFTSPKGFADQTAGVFVGALEELGLRFLDLVDDLPLEAMRFLPEGGANTISMLGVHMIWAEAGWVSRIADVQIPPEAEALVGLGRQDTDGCLPQSSYDPVELRKRWQHVHTELTRPSLRKAGDLERLVRGTSMSVRQVLMHLTWHWSYHSGQVGVLRRIWGEGYRWTFAQ